VLFLVIIIVVINNHYHYYGNEGTTEAAKPDEANSPEKAVNLNLVQQETAYGLHLPAPVA